MNNYHFCSYAYRTLRMRIQTVQIQGDVTVNSFEYHMTGSYPEIRPDMRDPVVNISHTMPLSESIRDNVVSVCHYHSCLNNNFMLHHQPEHTVSDPNIHQHKNVILNLIYANRCYQFWATYQWDFLLVKS